MSTGRASGTMPAMLSPVQCVMVARPTNTTHNAVAQLEETQSEHPFEIRIEIIVNIHPQ